MSHSLASLETTVRGPVLHRDAPVRPTALGAALLPHLTASTPNSISVDRADPVA